MYSIVETGGFQYKVELGKAYKVPTLALLVPNWSSSPFFFSQEKKCKSAPLS